MSTAAKPLDEVCGRCGKPWPSDVTTCQCGWHVSLLRPAQAKTDAKPLDDAAPSAIAVFRCRRLGATEWIEVAATSLANAVQAVEVEPHAYLTVWPDENPDGTGRYAIEFARVEVEGHGEFVVRTFHSGIYRKGGVGLPRAPLAERLAAVAAQLGWRKDPAELIAAGWEGEESSWH